MSAADATPANVLITGASSGIGEAVAERFRAGGSRVYLTGRRSQAPATMRDGERYLSGDLGDEAFVERLVAEAVAELGPLDTVVACHGMQGDGALTEMTLDRASQLLDANVLSVFAVLKHAVPAMRDGGGQIVLVSSRLGIVGIPGQVLYTAAKGGLIMLGKGAAIELAARNIRVNVAAPGLTETPAIEASFQRRDDPEAYRAQRAATIPMRRLARPEEVADAIYFLGSPASSYITGAVLPIDGGYTAA
ncbi:NAD(P)-dependent dehydrogenase (short-subunit alcohol dehydrogenase family) [Agrococcus sp. UYP10]|uniref:SDR family NAD(P)-dependent oxidoreductase n=1 Tax=Agrococcus sp. UYP10 TaxID=1756355 RepID=UPI003399824E